MAPVSFNAPVNSDAAASPDAAAGDEWSVILDERGRRCPLPVLALARVCAQQPHGTVIAVLSDDPAAQYDVPAWCRLKGATFLGEASPPDAGPGRAYLVQSGTTPPSSA